jgi:hypothetical protein
VVCVEDLGSKDMLIGAFFTWTVDESFALGRLISGYNVLCCRNCSSFYYWDCPNNNLLHLKSQGNYCESTLLVFLGGETRAPIHGPVVPVQSKYHLKS